MVFINSEGKFNENTHLIDGQLFRMKGNMAIYVIENKGIRMMIDTSEPLSARKIVKKMKEFGIFPIHKILLTHSHFDHMQALGKLKNLMKEIDIEVLASGLLNISKTRIFMEFLKGMKTITPMDIFYKYNKVRSEVLNLVKTNDNAKLGETIISFLT